MVRARPFGFHFSPPYSRIKLLVCRRCSYHHASSTLRRPRKLIHGNLKIPASPGTLTLLLSEMDSPASTAQQVQCKTDWTEITGEET